MRASIFVFVCACVLNAQDAAPMRVKDVREIAKGGSNALPRLGELLKYPDTAIRVEAVRQITDIGSLPSLDLLVQATHDNDGEVQVRAADGLVNFYLPGYVRTGFAASITRVGTSIKGRFTDTNDQTIDPFIVVRPDVAAAIGALVRGGNGMDVRAAAARDAGIQRAKGAVPDLLDALRTKNTDVLYESLIALQKIRDESAGPRIGFLLRDPDAKVQIAAIETMGLLRNQAAVPDLLGVLKDAKNDKVRRAALGSLAMMPNEQSRPVFQQYLSDKDDKMRAAAAEGFARLRNPADQAQLEKAWQAEGRTPPRLSLAFALVMSGRVDLAEFTPLQYLINNLNSSAYKGVAEPFLVELARDERVRAALYPALATGTKDEKIGLAHVLARSGDAASLPYLEKLTKDTDPAVSSEGVRAMRNLKARL
ncbi:MAG TPA: HEAT repeat domain-containing protein [Candidatus Acidoferrum sp.]|nr:HEAT repeat domain-containing protein [Candidatus Acidoferrum sp.]